MNQLWYRIESVFPSSVDDWSSIIEIYRDFGMENTEQLTKGIAGYLIDKTCFNDLEKRLKDNGASEVILSEIKEEEWAESWKQYFKPKAIGQKFWIQPTWDKQPVPNDKLCIELDPGQAFGTGDHPTTKMCLTLLEDQVTSGLKVADIGCGSGILSIGACLLGASEVIAVDNDSVSVEAAKENALLNKVHYQVHEGLGFSPFNKDERFDIVVSNIISAAIIGLIPQVIDFLKPEGKWIVSGIIKENWKDVEQALTSARFHIVQVEEEGEWIAALVCR